MKQSIKKDIHLLITINKQQAKIKDVLKDFNCSSRNLTQSKYAFDLCAMYIAQLGEAGKMLTDSSKEALNCLNPDMMRHFRNMIDHVYEKVDRTMLSAYIFNTVSPKAIKEVTDRIAYCKNHVEEQEKTLGKIKKSKTR